MTFPAFTNAVPDNGYRWWYVDAVSDDSQHALTIIVFIGSVFSPYYAWARKRGRTPALQHCSINVALYGSPARWCMTERDERSVKTHVSSMKVGNSRISVTDKCMQININERAVPLPWKVKGQVRIPLLAHDLPAQPLDLPNKENARHFWQPIAPHTRINVEMESPALQWQGNAYVDSNHGDIPLESSFKSWTWSRSHEANGDTSIHYKVLTRDGQTSCQNRKYTSDGQIIELDNSSETVLSPTRYFRIKRTANIEQNHRIEALQTLEDAPFYARSRYIEIDQGEIDQGEIHKGETDKGEINLGEIDKRQLDKGETNSVKRKQEKNNAPDGMNPARSRTTVHESLDLDRFDSAWVRCLLPFRMPRITRPVLLT
ncbi:MAG: carotenoid 1,2-hydratase [Granulosicoccus sp.]|nr:carotenoid 1,2-hydratase [Granulosicoccus sp.]